MAEQDKQLPEWPLWIARVSQLLVLLALAIGRWTLIWIAMATMLLNYIAAIYITWPSRHRKRVADEQSAMPDLRG